MGNSNSKKDDVFVREKANKQKKKEKVKDGNRRVAGKDVVTPHILTSQPGPSAPPTAAHIRSYDEEALAWMRYQLKNDANGFLLNNILLSVQFFENYERDIQRLKSNSKCENEQLINEAMVNENKHVFFADRLQECVHENVLYQRSPGQTEPLASPRLYVIYDNIEASEPGDTSNYSPVLDAPFYKLQIEYCKAPGYVKLKKMEVIESTLHKEDDNLENTKNGEYDDSYTDSERESVCEDDDEAYNEDGEELMQKLNSKYSEPALNGNLEDNINFSGFPEPNNNFLLVSEEFGTRRGSNSFMKNRTMSGPIPNKKLNTNLRKASSETNIGEDTESSGYRSNSSRHTDSSETESDYGYATITESATPKRIKLSMRNANDSSISSGILPEESWTPIEVKALNDLSDDDEKDIDDSASKSSLTRNLFETYVYLNSQKFMSHFVDNFIINLGSGLGLSQDDIHSASSQGASIYCDSNKNGSKMGYEILPALNANWPHIADQWIIRKRRVITNPRNNFSYEWPSKYVIGNANGTGCLLVPVGYRLKRGLNPEQKLQWKIVFPAAERYLESCLAHSHMRCYLFTLVLHKTFFENETAKIGIEASHIKNHLYWQCEHNFARWPEDRLGESLLLFLESFFKRFAISRSPNYFISNCNEFQSIPNPIITKIQRRLFDILESPVMHMLYALDKLQYTKKDYYPALNVQELNNILTCKNPIRLLNPNIPESVSKSKDNFYSDEEDDDNSMNYMDKFKMLDKDYQWQMKMQQKLQNERRYAKLNEKSQNTRRRFKEINKDFTIPRKMDSLKRRLVLQFFISHFKSMANESERFGAIRQAIIYLEQSKRLSVLLSDEVGVDEASNERNIKIIQEKLKDCQRQLVQRNGYDLPPRRKTFLDHGGVRQRPKFERSFGHGNTANNGVPNFTSVDIHNETSKETMILNDMPTEDSRL